MSKAMMKIDKTEIMVYVEEAGKDFLNLEFVISK